MTKSWFKLSLLAIFLFALACRFWGLGRFNTLVFDEIYYAKFGSNYLTNVPFFDAHPPLGKLIIAVGIWFGNQVPWWQTEVNGLTGQLLSPLSYRWINAFLGAFIPVILAGIAYQLSHRRVFAVITGLFAACDGIFLVEARYALINQYIVLFGLLGHFCFLLALNRQRLLRHLWLGLCGVCFGAAIATKWNGLWYLLGIYLIGGLGWLINWFGRFFPIIPSTSESEYSYRLKSEVESQTNPLQKLAQLNLLHVIIYLIIIPVVTYSFLWVPHLWLDTRYNFVEVHQQIFGFHDRMDGNNASVHPYCSPWYTWPLMIRPMAYLYQTASNINDPLPVYGPPLPAKAHKIIYDVHAMGNPILWWLGLATLFLILVLLILRLDVWIRHRRFVFPNNFTSETWIGLYILINYLINLAPWVKVSRCIFIYHYMTGVVFAFLALAWFVDWCLRNDEMTYKFVGLALTGMVVGGFSFWLPIYLGLPLTVKEYGMRMWFNSWI